jgi:hypothetical protein
LKQRGKTIVKGGLPHYKEKKGCGTNIKSEAFGGSVTAFFSCVREKYLQLNDREGVIIFIHKSTRRGKGIAEKEIRFLH